MVWRSADGRPDALSSYRRTSATWSAIATDEASSGSSAIPYDEPTSKASPRSESAVHAVHTVRSESSAGASTQNSSPPIR